MPATVRDVKLTRTGWLAKMLGTISDLVAAHVQSARMAQGLSARELAARCASIGAHQLTAAVIANIETGRRDVTGKRRRDVTIDELCAIALALGHQPADMLGPHEDYSTIQVTSDISAAPLEIAAWMQGSINSAVPSLLGGIALCEVCRVSLMARNSDDGTVYYCANLACRGPQVNKLASIIDPPVSALIVARLHTIDPQEVAKAHGRDIKAELAALDVELENFRRRRAETQRQFEELADYPQLSVKVLAKSLASFDQKIEQINREQVRVRRYATMAGIEDIAQWWDEAPLLQRRAIVEEMMTITIPASSEIDAEPADVQSSFKNIRYEWR